MLWLAGLFFFAAKKISEKIVNHTKKTWWVPYFFFVLSIAALVYAPLPFGWGSLGQWAASLLGWVLGLAGGLIGVSAAVLGAVLLVILPLGAVAWYSLHDWNALSGQFRFTGAENYTALLEDSTLHASLVSSVLFSSGVVALNISLALLLAVLLNQKVRGSTFFRVLFFSPVVVSLVAWSELWLV